MQKGETAPSSINSREDDDFIVTRSDFGAYSNVIRCKPCLSNSNQVGLQ